jgi:transposase
LIEETKEREDWAIGFQDEVWWSRLAQPNLHSWTEDAPLKLVAREDKKDDPDPKALACYGIDIRFEKYEEVWIRFVKGNPKSDPTIDFMKWTLEKTAEKNFRVLLMLWDHATWHKSQKVRSWLYQHNQEVKRTGEGTRLLAVLLPKKSPWLNPIEARWVHAKRKVLEPERKLSAKELSERVCAVFKQPVLPWIANSNNVT